METYQAKEILSKMKSAWTNIYSNSDGERMQLFVNCIIKYDYRDADKKIDKLISTRKNYPSIAELEEFLNIDEQYKSQINANCKICDNTGWKFIDDTGHGTVVKCSCGKLD